MFGRTFYKRAKCYKEQSIPRSRVIKEAKCAGEQLVSGNKVFQGSKCVEEKIFLSNNELITPIPRIARILEKSVTCKNRISGTVLIIQLMQDSPTYTYIGKNPRKWRPR